ncbi:MAG: RNA polymerase sigma factor RpoD/SigA [Methanomassiliicoccales archaeon]|jgi:RNA polymerase primary sigma factor
MKQSIDYYIQSISSYSQLISHELASKLLSEYKQGNSLAKEKLIMSNLRLVISIAKRYANFGLPLVDLISEGNIGLTKSIDRWNPDKSKLSYYASWWIHRYILKALSEKTNTIRIPYHVNSQLRKIFRARRLLESKIGKLPNDEELADYLDISIEELHRRDLKVPSAISINQTIGDTDQMFVDVLQDEDSISPSQKTENDDNYTKLMDVVKSVLDHREQDIVCSVMGLNGHHPVTFEIIANKYKIRRQRVHKVYKESLKKIKSGLRKSLPLDDFHDMEQS